MNTTCITCGDIVVPSLRQRGGGNKKFCSAKCRRKSRAVVEALWRKEDRRDNPEKYALKSRITGLKRNYKMTIEDYESLVSKQKGKCPVCGELLPLIEKENGKHPPVDHDHFTGKPRGVLHNRCNRAIGLLNDDSEICLKAAAYLKINGS